MADEMIPIMKEFKEIQSCIRCSAQQQYNVNQAFYLCQRAVTHPIAPLFDSKEGCLKQAAIAALERIFCKFKICYFFFFFFFFFANELDLTIFLTVLSDNDQDGVLSDREFNELQKKCFKKSLEPMDLQFLKNALLEISPTAVTATGITEEGFILLNKLYAEKGRHETTWGILRSFHYTDSLSLEDTFLYPKLDVPVNSSVELSPEGYRFLVDLFVLFDKDNDGGLNDLELESLFKPSPGIPKLWQEFNFPQTTVRNDLGNITLQGWLAQWSMTTYLDYKTTTAYLALLGFESQHQSMRKITDALKVTRPRKQRNPSTRSYRNSVVDRNVFNCYVVGSPGSGKTSLLTAFLNRPFTEIYSPTIKPFTVVNSVEMTGGKQCYLILEELGELEPAVLENQSRLDSCDVLCFVYDSSDPDSFTYLVELCQKNPLLERLPAVYVALKADLDRQQQRSSMQPDAYTSKLNMASPLHVSVQWPQALNELFVQLSEAALRPGSATPHVDLEEEESNLIPMAAIALGLGAFAVTLSWYLRSFSHGSH